MAEVLVTLAIICGIWFGAEVCFWLLAKVWPRA